MLKQEKTTDRILQRIQIDGLQFYIHIKYRTVLFSYILHLMFECPVTRVDIVVK